MLTITCNGFKYFYNRRVHGVPFEEAAECIFSTQAIVDEDIEHSTPTERRFNLISVSPVGRVLLVGVCKRFNGLQTRIISARRASRKERRRYFEKFGEHVTFRAIKHENPIFQIRLI
jgi:uncharacterized DUF497 family protein